MTRQGQILQVIERYVATHGCSPSNREIAAAAGLRSPSTVLRYLRQLKADGYLTYQPGVPRTVRVLPRPRPPADDEQVLDIRDPDKVVWVPFLGRMPRDMAVAREELRLLHVAPGSVTAPGVRPGDWVVVRRPPGGPQHGTVIAVLRQVEPVTSP
ncbi:MAG TPA: helix-turn-helix domain-containing protein [Streptosporangiaceae bacterium]|jgi:repressor LexA